MLTCVNSLPSKISLQSVSLISFTPISCEKLPVKYESEINGSDLFKGPIGHDKANWIVGVRSSQAAEVDCADR